MKRRTNKKRHTLRKLVIYGAIVFGVLDGGFNYVNSISPNSNVHLQDPSVANAKVIPLGDGTYKTKAFKNQVRVSPMVYRVSPSLYKLCNEPLKHKSSYNFIRGVLLHFKSVKGKGKNQRDVLKPHTSKRVVKEVYRIDHSHNKKTIKYLWNQLHKAGLVKLNRHGKPIMTKKLIKIESKEGLNL